MTRSRGAPWRQDLSLLGRLRALSSQAFNNGVGYFLVSISCIVLCVLCLRFADDYHRVYSDQLAKQLEYLGGESEPQREDRYNGISSMLLGSVNLNWRDRSAEQQYVTGYRVADDGRRIVDDLANNISDILSRHPSGISDLRQVSMIADSLIAGMRGSYPDYFFTITHDVSSQIPELRNVISDVLQYKWPRMIEIKPANSGASNQSTGGWLVAPEYPHESAGMVPSLYADIMSKDPPDWSDHRLGTLERRVLRYLVYSRLLDAVAIALETLANNEASQGRQSPWYQAHFISPDNILRLWQQDGRSEGVVGKLPSHRYWAAAKYEEDMFSGQCDEYQSRAYFDYAEGGVVFTQARLCRYADGEVVGLVATDQRVSMESFLETVASQVLLFDMTHVSALKSQLEDGRGAEVRIPARNGPWDRLCAVVGRDNGSNKKAWREAKPQTAHRAIAVVAAASSKPGFCKGIQGVMHQDRISYVLPIGIEGNGMINVLVLDPHKPQMPAEVFIFGILGILCGAFSVCLFVIGIRLCGSDNELESRRALLRGLQVGFVRCNGDGVIVEGNDRAEEILGVKLPMLDGRLGARTTAQRLPHPWECAHAGSAPRRLGDFIKEESVILRGETEDDTKLTNLLETQDRLSRGKRSLMYASLKTNGNLISILSSPILGTAKSSIAGGYFATFDVLNNIEAQAVMDEFELLRARLKEPHTLDGGK